MYEKATWEVPAPLALRVKCPVCGRYAGMICVDPRGNGRWGRPHKTRAKLALKSITK